LTDAISSNREYENVQGLEDEGAWMRENSTFQICEVFIGCKNKNYRSRVIIEITTKILLSIGICKAKWFKD
jgi:hypothetical protein